MFYTISYVNKHHWLILYSIYHIARNFRQEKIFANFTTCSFWGKFYTNFSHVSDCIEDMVTFTALVKIFSTEYFCNTKVVGLGEIFVQ